VESTALSTLFVTYWFSERFGLQLPNHAETRENKAVTSAGDSKEEIKSGGVGLYAGFRF